MKNLFVVLVISVLCFSCSFRIYLPDKYKYTLSDRVVFEVKDTKLMVDSVFVISHGRIIRGECNAGQYSVLAKEFYPGVNQLSINVVKKSGKTVIKDRAVFIVSDIVPKEYFLQEIGQLPHDTSAFTQGLAFYKDLLYESTGIKGKSRLRIINPNDGACIKEKTTDVDLFNEGISIINDTLFQLTWKDSVLVILDLDFNEICRVDIPMEGWGLCSKDDKLYVSDGSNMIIKIDPVTMDFIDTLRVIDDKGPVYHINEMEWVEDYIWANIYGKDKIVVIDPGSGIVIATLSSADLIDRKYYNEAGVMNGIAYDPLLKRVFLTGKNWPFIKVCILANDF